MGLYEHPITIGSVRVPGNLFLAPLAGYTDRAFREVCLREGASLTCSEMISAEAIARGNAKTFDLAARAPSERQFAIQLFMPDAETAKRAVSTVKTFAPTIIDINCGCPVPKIVNNGAGSALMRNPLEIRRIVQTLVNALSIPVTVKIRLGWDMQSKNFLEVADAAADGGASLITMHARTKTQGYSGSADWNALEQLKSHIHIPVAGSGDLFTPEDALRMLRETGVDALMFARGALGNPFIFSQTKQLLNDGELAAEPTREERFSRALEQLELAIAEKGEQRACKEMRKHVCAYSKGLSNSNTLRAAIVKASSLGDYQRLLKT
ncbi:MAG: tRNA dihydrouridine synthase DusB [Spirochaetota bacterium]